VEIILWYHAVETFCRYKTLNAVFILEDIFILEGVFILGAHAQRGLLYLVCVSVCVCVCVCVCLCVCVSVCLSPLILSLQGPSRLISDTNGSSATRAQKIMW